jgi:hypothetical protein
MNELGTNNKNKNITGLYRGINEFKNGYRTRINIVRDVNGNADRWKIFFNQVLNGHGVHNVRWIYIQLRHYCQNLILSKWE